MRKDENKNFLQFVIEREKKRLKLPEDFEVKIYRGFEQPFLAGFVSPIVENGKLKGVRIKIYGENSKLGDLLILLHEFYHAKRFYQFYIRNLKGYENSKMFYDEYSKQKREFLEEILADFYAYYRTISSYLPSFLLKKRNPAPGGI